MGQHDTTHERTVQVWFANFRDEDFDALSTSLIVEDRSTVTQYGFLTGIIIINIIKQLGQAKLDVLPPPLYSQDLSPTDCQIFRHLEHFLKRQNIQNPRDLMNFR